MSYRLRPRRDSAKVVTGSSPLTVMDVNHLASTHATSSSGNGPKRSPPSSISGSSTVSNKRLRSFLTTPSPRSFNETSLHNRSLLSSRSRFESYDATGLTSPDQHLRARVVTPPFASPPTMTASSISMTSSWWSSTFEQSLTNLPPTSPLRASKANKKKKGATTATASNIKVRTDDLQMTAVVPDGSIGKNAQDYYLLIRESRNQKISMKDAATALGIKVRRVYDVTNVLEGVGLIRRSSQPEMSMQLCPKEDTKGKKQQTKALRNELDVLEHEEAQLDTWIQLLQDEESHDEEDKALNYIPVKDLLHLPASNGSSVVISMNPGSALHQGSHGRSNCSFSIRAPESGFGSSGSLPAFVLEGGSKANPSVRPLLLTFPPLLTACTSDFTEHALQDFTKHHHNQKLHNSSSSYQHSEFSQFSVSQQSEDGDVDDKMNDAASTLARMSVIFDKVERSPLTAVGTRPFSFWST